MSDSTYAQENVFQFPGARGRARCTPADAVCRADRRIAGGSCAGEGMAS